MDFLGYDAGSFAAGLALGVAFSIAVVLTWFSFGGTST